MTATQTVQKWGNGTGIRLSKKVLQAVDFDVNQQVEISVEDGYLIVKPLKSKPNSDLRNMLAGVSPSDVNGEYDLGAPTGKELL
jgi:antitoxin MazE